MTFKALLLTKEGETVSSNVVDCSEARDLDLDKLGQTVQTVGLADVPRVVRELFEGKVRGRTVVNVNE